MSLIHLIRGSALRVRKTVPVNGSLRSSFFTTPAGEWFLSQLDSTVTFRATVPFVLQLKRPDGKTPAMAEGQTLLGRTATLSLNYHTTRLWIFTMHVTQTIVCATSKPRQEKTSGCSGQKTCCQTVIKGNGFMRCF